MGTLHALPGRDQRAWHILWSLFRNELREQWSWVDPATLDADLAACERFVRPFFDALMEPMEFQLAGVDTLRAAQLSPEVGELVASEVDRLLRDFIQVWANAQGGRVRIAVMRLAAEFLLQRIESRRG